MIFTVAGGDLYFTFGSKVINSLSMSFAVTRYSTRNFCIKFCKVEFKYET